MGQPILYPLRQGVAAEAFIAYIELQSNAGAAPDGLVDICDVVSADTVPSYAATGLYTVTFEKRYQKIIPLQATIEDVLLAADPYDVVDGYSAANTVKFATLTKATGAPVESNNKTMQLVLLLVP